MKYLICIFVVLPLVFSLECKGTCQQFGEFCNGYYDSNQECDCDNVCCAPFDITSTASNADINSSLSDQQIESTLGVRTIESPPSGDNIESYPFDGEIERPPEDNNIETPSIITSGCPSTSRCDNLGGKCQQSGSFCDGYYDFDSCNGTCACCLKYQPESFPIKSLEETCPDTSSLDESAGNRLNPYYFTKKLKLFW